MSKVVQICFDYTTDASICSMEGNVIVDLTDLLSRKDYYKYVIEEVLSKSPRITGWRLRSIVRIESATNEVIHNVLGLVTKTGTVIYRLPQNMLVGEVLRLL